MSGGTAGAVGGGGIANDPTFGGTDSKLVIKNTLDSNNNAENPTGTNVTAAGVDIVGPTETTISNLIGNYNATAAPGITTANGNQLGPSSSVVPGLAASLADNGGPTESLALLPSSTALGAGNVADAGGTTDQRGEPRIVNGKVDIGALETQPGPTVTASGTTNTYQIGSGTPVTVDAGMTVSSTDAQLTAATLTISSGTLQTGDTLNFTNQNGITGSYSGGVTDPRRHSHSGTVSSGVGFGHVLDDQHQQDDPGDLGRCRRQ